MAQKSTGEKVKEAVAEPLANQLSQVFQNLAQAMAERLLLSLSDRVDGVTSRLTDYAEGTGTGLLAALTGSKESGDESSTKGGRLSHVKETVKGLAGGLSKGGKKLRLTNIVESIDIGAPVRVVYNQWTQFQDFPSFMKKVENVEQASDEKLTWSAQVFLSHRTWESQIVEQVPDDRIIWRSKGDKGYVDGAVTFHEITPNLTKVILVLEYHPRGVVERVGNIWHAQGRRARLEFKHFGRHVMTEAMLRPDEMEENGWRGEIHDGEIVEEQEEAPEEAEAEEEAEEPEEEAAEEEEEPEEEEEEAEEEEEEEAPEEAEAEEEEPEEEEPEEEEEAEEEEEEEEEKPKERPQRGRAGRTPQQKQPVRRKARA